ncbi:MAG: polyprenyl synthetase family protein [Parcubacteria group bacterium]|nr:polyprenyl synthetase family protein [Parcubacteria group bacterium]
MNTPDEILQLLKKYNQTVEKEIDSLLRKKKGSASDMYGMMRYFMGFTDEKFTGPKVYGGKRFRSALCLLIADLYGTKKDKKKGKAVAQKGAASLELFHNFTLIHDDIVDKDPLRRGRPTVWKLWGVDHAINTGDAQLVLSQIKALEACETDTKRCIGMNRFLLEKYLEVIEGQHLDFFLTALKIGDSRVNEKSHYEMIGKKTAVLIAAAAQTAGIACGKNQEERALLWKFGYSLGMAYQLNDDIVSIWGAPDITGKISYNDLREKKKTLPVIYAFAKLSENGRKEFEVIYDKETSLEEQDLKYVLSCLESAKSYEYARKQVLAYLQRAESAISQLAVSKEGKETLLNVSKLLLVEVKK